MADPARHTLFTGDMADVSALCGQDVALALVETLPGLEVKIPREWSGKSMLRHLPREVAEKLIKTFPAETLYIPTQKGSANTRIQAKSLRGEGRTNAEIALELGITERHVRGLLNSSGCRARDPRQIEMFNDAPAHGTLPGETQD